MPRTCYLLSTFSPSPISEGYYYPSIWISTPPLLIEDTSLTVYFCSGYYFFYHANRYGARATMRATIREANASSTWSYTERFLSYHDSDCRGLYNKNFTNNYLVTHHTFSSLQPNTPYSLKFLGCFFSWQRYYRSYTVGYSYLSYTVSMTTRPTGEWWTSLPSLPSILYLSANTITNHAKSM